MTPEELFEQIIATFEATTDNDDEILAILALISKDEADYETAANFADIIGQHASNALREWMTEEKIGNDTMTQEMVDKTIIPMLRENYERISTEAGNVQEALNRASNIGLKAKIPAFDEEAAQNLANKAMNVANSEGVERMQWVLDEPVKLFSRGVVDATMEENVKFHSRTGLQPKIMRKLRGGGCKWCTALAGVYHYGEEPPDFYRKHERCRCVLTYFPGDGKKQDVWSKKWTKIDARDILESRKITGIRPAFKTLHPVNPSTGEVHRNHEIKITDKQRGKKFGEHARDFGLDPGSKEDRERFEEIILDIVNNPDERAYGDWRQQDWPVLFHIKGEDVVVESKYEEFITILKGGVNNARVKNARHK